MPLPSMKPAEMIDDPNADAAPVTEETYPEASMLPLPEGTDLKVGDRFSGKVDGKVVDQDGKLCVEVESIDGAPVGEANGSAQRDGTGDIENELSKKLKERAAAQAPEMGSETDED